MVKNHKEPDSMPELSKTYTTTKFLDQFPMHLRELHGVNGITLSYVIHVTVVVPVVLPPVINAPIPRIWNGTHTSMMEELISYTPHNGQVYDSDNARVYALLAKLLSGTSAMASISIYKRSRNSREVYLSLIIHNVGSSKWDQTVETAEGILNSSILNGTNSRYPIKVHINRNREAYNNLERASHHMTYVPPNETSRVRYLLNSIQSSDATICAANTTILADTSKKNDFELAADFIMITGPASKFNSDNQHRVSGLKRHRSKKGKIKTDPKTGVELCFFK